MTHSIKSSGKNNKLLYISDLHLELRPNLNYNKLLQQKAKYLVLAGDIGNPVIETNSYIKFLSAVSKSFKYVFYILGNHEYYNNQKITLPEMRDKIMNICSKFRNIYILDNDSYELEDENIIILGTTLWSMADHIEASRCNDYQRIWIKSDDSVVNITTADTTYWHQKNVDWLSSKIKDKNYIIISHYAPLLNSPGYYLSHPKYPMTSCFQTDLTYLMNDNIKVWIYGHTHYNNDFIYSNIRICSNQVGYDDEKLLFSYSIHIDLDQLWIDDI